MPRNEPVALGVWRASCLALLLPLALAGCGKETAEVKGKVLTADGKPLRGGLLVVMRADGRGEPDLATINPDGTFTLLKAPLGKVFVSVDNREVEGGPNVPLGGRSILGGRNGPRGPTREELERLKAQGKSAADLKLRGLPGQYQPIKKKYYSLETTDLKKVIEAGNELIIRLN
jgi:hypothetical protein